MTAAAALLVTRRARVGILGWVPDADPARAVRTLASLADLAPDRVVGRARRRPGRVACGRRRDAGAPDRARVLRRRARARRRARLGLDRARDAARRAREGRRRRGSHRRRSACTCRWSSTPTPRSPDAPRPRRCCAPLADAVPADGMVVGDPDRLGAVIDEYVERGVHRIVIDDLLAFGAPEQLEAGRAAVRDVVRRARLRHRPDEELGRVSGADGRRARPAGSLLEGPRRPAPRRPRARHARRRPPVLRAGGLRARPRGRGRRRAAPHVRIEQLPRPRRRPAGDRGGAGRGRPVRHRAAPARGS